MAPARAVGGMCPSVVPTAEAHRHGSALCVVGPARKAT